MLNKDFIRNEWIPALRSGTYKQGQGWLSRNLTSFCCLGVACDILHPEQWVFNEDHTAYGIQIGSTTWTEALPAELLNEIGMSDGQQRQLVELNDNLGWTFDEIADYLEKMCENA